MSSLIHLFGLRYQLWLLASKMLAAPVASFVLVVSLIGCLSVGLVTFIFPPLFHYNMSQRLRATSADPDEDESSSLLVQSGLPTSSSNTSKVAALSTPPPSMETVDLVMLLLGIISTVFTTGMTLASVAESVKGGLDKT